MQKCPKCNTIWFYFSNGDYSSGYERKGYKLNCHCGYAWGAVDWKKSKEELINEWENQNGLEKENAARHEAY